MVEKILCIVHKTRLSIQINILKGDDVFMSNNITSKDYPYLLNREQASSFLGIDPKSFDKYIRPHSELDRFMIGRQERYTVNSLINFIEKQII